MAQPQVEVALVQNIPVVDGVLQTLEPQTQDFRLAELPSATAHVATHEESGDS